jgi:hypothetical protein
MEPEQFQKIPLVGVTREAELRIEHYVPVSV